VSNKAAPLSNRGPRYTAGTGGGNPRIIFNDENFMA
jgi:hypothetical protein